MLHRKARRLQAEEELSFESVARLPQGAEARKIGFDLRVYQHCETRSAVRVDLYCAVDSALCYSFILVHSRPFDGIPLCSSRHSARRFTALMPTSSRSRWMSPASRPLKTDSRPSVCPMPRFARAGSAFARR